jgi:hypothetical protein
MQKYMWLGIIVAFVSGGGTLLLVNSVLSGARTKLAVSEAILDKSNKKLEDVDKAMSTVNAFEEKLRVIAENANAADAHYKSLFSRSKATAKELSDFSRENLAVSEILQQQLGRLTDVVNELSDRAAPHDPRLGDAIRSIVSGIGTASSEIVRNRRGLDLSQFPIEVRRFQPDQQITENIMSDLRAEGLTARYFRMGMFEETPERNRAILVGRAVPVEVAAKAIAVAKKHAPFLKYVRFDFRDEEYITIGGNTQKAIEAAVRPATDEEFDALMNAKQSQTDFHRLIESFYETSGTKRSGPDNRMESDED